MLKILYYGGQKSGKSKISEKRALELAENKKPYYIATYNNNYGDIEMSNRITKHKRERGERFITIEENLDLVKHIHTHETYLIDCISMWILNSMDRNERELISHIEELGRIDANIIFVRNSINSGVIPLGQESRRFVDLTGTIGQRLAFICDEVYEIKLGLKQRLK